MVIFDKLGKKGKNSKLEKVLQQSIQELENDLGKINAQKLAIETQDLQISNKLNKCKEEIQKLDRYINQALKDNNKMQVNTFLLHKQKALKEKDETEKRQKLSKESLAKVINLTNNILGKIQREKDKLNELKAQLNLSKIHKNINKPQRDTLKESIQESINTAEGMQQLNELDNTDKELEDFMKKYSK